MKTIDQLCLATQKQKYVMIEILIQTLIII